MFANSLMMTSISERIELVIKELGYNKNSFSKAIGMGNNVTIGRIINEKRDPSYEVLQRIIQTFGHMISAKWLLTGEGRMKIDAGAVNDPQEVYNLADRENMSKVLANLEFLSESMHNELEKLKTMMR